MSDAAANVSVLLRRWSDGDQSALEQLTPLVYTELHSLARGYLRRERNDHTLQTTALVNEAFIRMLGQERVSWQTRAQFIGVAAQAMRRILVDHARRRLAEKRPDPRLRVDPDEMAGLPDRPEALVALDAALCDLARLDPRQARLVELKYFAGLDLEQIAETLDISSATVSREWTLARGWLRQQLAD